MSETSKAENDPAENKPAENEVGAPCDSTGAVLDAAGPSRPLSPTSPDLHPFRMECPHCGESVTVAAVQGDRCPGCHFEFTWFDPGQDLVAQEFYQVLTGAKYSCGLPGGSIVVIHG